MTPLPKGMSTVVEEKLQGGAASVLPVKQSRMKPLLIGLSMAASIILIHGLTRN